MTSICSYWKEEKLRMDDDNVALIEKPKNHKTLIVRVKRDTEREKITPPTFRR